MIPDFKIGDSSSIYLGKAADVLRTVLPERRVIVISDVNVDRLHHSLLAPYETILPGLGETTKTLSTVESVCRRLIELGADRSTFLLGVGGGIITDITGFVGSVYMRGVEFGFVPTTLLGQVDAGVGGKTGVNVGGYKNMVGTFCQPRFVVCDTDMLTTLPDREFRAGLAEALKVGIIADAGLFAQIEAVPYKQLRTDAALLHSVVTTAIGVKTAIVGRDQCEHGERRKLNLGHTLAHAIEKCTPKLNHGEAVAVGLALISQASVRLGLLPQSDCDRIVQVLSVLGFDLMPPVEMKRLLREVVKDKKSESEWLYVALPVAIGGCEVRRMTHVEFTALFV